MGELKAAAGATLSRRVPRCPSNPSLLRLPHCSNRLNDCDQRCERSNNKKRNKQKQMKTRSPFGRAATGVLVPYLSLSTKDRVREVGQAHRETLARIEGKTARKASQRRRAKGRVSRRDSARRKLGGAVLCLALPLITKRNTQKDVRRNKDAWATSVALNC